MNTPSLETERLRLRRFTENDIEALYLILKDEEANRFLPWFPVKSLEEAAKFYEERFVSQYQLPQAYAYAICLRSDDIPIGYIKADTQEPYDFGYAIRKDFWNQGIAAEAAVAVIEQVKNDGIPYLSATHDRNNPKSGAVMQKAGMKYCYSYKEQWQPKDIPVIFRMYQINFSVDNDFVYQGYRRKYPEHFIEELEIKSKTQISLKNTDKNIDVFR